MTQKRDLRENRCFITFFSAAKVSNTKAFIDRSRSVTLIDPMTRGLKVHEEPFQYFVVIVSLH